MNKDNLILVGKIVGVHGIKGEVKILPYGGCDKKSWKKINLFKGGHTVAVCEVLDNRPHKGVILAVIKGCNNRDSAQEVVGCDVFIDKGLLPMLSEGEYYHFQLQGMEVVTDDGKTIGAITDIFRAGSNDVYVVKGVSGEILIPAINDVVVKVDIDNRKMIVRMLEGLQSGENEI